MNIFLDTNIGQVSNGVHITEARDMHGELCYRATSQITNIFGAELGQQGPVLEGIGVTEEQAVERLRIAERAFNDSLWF